MKNHIHLAVVRLLSAILCSITISALAAVPVRWTAEMSRVQPIALDAWRGDTLALECTLTSYGQPVAIGAATASLMWQTNGMGSAWWQTNATVSADGVIRATWSPSMDPGAPAVAFFLPVQTGDGSIYRAAGTLRFRPSPGSGSQIADLPQPGGTLDFGEFNLVNAPWATLAAANEAISAAVTSATGALVIPPPVDLTPYATTGSLQAASTALADNIQLALNASSNYTDQVSSSLSTSITSSTNSLGTVLRDNIAEFSATSRAYADGVASNAQAYADAVASNAQRSAIAAIPSLAGYATETYVDSAISAIDMPSLSGYATTAYADAAASNAQAAAIAAIPSLAGYATESYVDSAISAIDMPSLAGYATTAYADAAASNAQAAAIAAIPSLAGYATETYVDSAISAIVLPSLSGYATTAYADSAASNAQAAAIAAIPSLAGYATETYAQNAASDAASDALSAAQSYARDLSWGASQGNTRLVSLDGTIWQDATGTVWQVSYVYGWSGTAIDLQTSAARPITFFYAGKTTTAPNTTSPTDYWSAGGGTNLYFDADMAQAWELWMTNNYHGATNQVWQSEGSPPPPITATNLSFNTAFELYALFYQPVALATNPIDHVIYEQSPGLRDIIAEQSTNAVSAVLGAFASTGTVIRAENAEFAANASYANYATSATWAGRLSSGGSLETDNLTFEDVLAGLAASSNYTDAVAAEFESGERSVGYADYAEEADAINGDEGLMYQADLILAMTNAAITVSSRKQDALPYPTNAIPYAAISGAPSGGPEWRVDNQSSHEIHYVTNGMANVQMGAELSCNTNGWCDGAAMFARFTIASGISYEVMDDRVRLVGYGTWPTNNFQSVWWRSGTNIFVNILLEE